MVCVCISAQVPGADDFQHPKERRGQNHSLNEEIAAADLSPEHAVTRPATPLSGSAWKLSPADENEEMKGCVASLLFVLARGGGGGGGGGGFPACYSKSQRGGGPSWGGE